MLHVAAEYGQVTLGFLLHFSLNNLAGSRGDKQLNIRIVLMHLAEIGLFQPEGQLRQQNDNWKLPRRLRKYCKEVRGGLGGGCVEPLRRSVPLGLAMLLRRVLFDFLKGDIPLVKSRFGPAVVAH